MAYQQLNVDQVTIAATGFKGPEGVVVDREGNVYGGGADGVIRKLSPDDRVMEVARTGGRPAGMALDREGNLFVCDVGKAAVLKVTPRSQLVCRSGWHSKTLPPELPGVRCGWQPLRNQLY